MERSARIATGESVTFEYELAGLGSRFIATLVDFAIQIATLAALIFAVVVLLAFATGKPLDIQVGTSRAIAGSLDKVALAIVEGIFSIIVFLIFFGYFIYFEWRYGRTPGKALLGLRVVRDGGFPLDFTASLVRNAVRMLEFAFGFYFVSAVSALLSPFNRRLGDYAAGTLVVRDTRFMRQALPTYTARPEDAVVRDLRQNERDLVLQYVARRTSLREPARSALAARIAAAIRPKLAASFGHLSDDDLLVHLAATAL